MAFDDSALPAHVEETIRAIRKLHADHQKEAALPERFVEKLTSWIGRPLAIAILTVAVSVWIGCNLLSPYVGIRAWDPPPFDYLQGIITILALYATILILITQRRDDRLASHRDQLTLQLAIMGEQKSAKIIALLEEMRADHPHLPDRVDDDARAMAVAADPQAMLGALEKKTADSRLDQPDNRSI